MGSWSRRKIDEHVSQRLRKALKDESDFKESPFFSDNEI